MNINEMDAASLRQMFYYDGSNLRWREVSIGRAKIGHLAGGVHPSGYRRIHICGHHYLAHRLVWLYVNGRWPKGSLDHINRDKDDNSIRNLREASSATNARNRGPNKANKFRQPGIVPRRDRFGACIIAGGEYYWLGTFDTAAEAIAARKSGEIQHWGLFA